MLHDIANHTKYHAAAEYHAAALYIVLYHAQHIQLYTQTLHLHAQSHQHMIFFASFFPLFDLAYSSYHLVRFQESNKPYMGELRTWLS